jgi:aromatic amino acid transport protein AroP
MKRKLSNRRVQLITLGGTIGTGLFLGSAGILELAGPSMVLGYLIAGFIAFLTMRFLSEMLVEDPTSSLFSQFAKQHWGGFAGFFAGWNCFIVYVLVGMFELTAAVKFIRFWWPEAPSWLAATIFFLVLNAINVVNLRLYGETEFWFSMIKILAVVGTIVLGLYLLTSGKGGEHASVTNLWQAGGRFPNGAHGLISATTFIFFSFGGIEMPGFMTAETFSTTTTIPKAINRVILRVMLFYVGSMLVLLCLTPWTNLLASLTSSGESYNSSPFVIIFSILGDKVAANALNFIMLAAALSLYNGMIYCNSRLLCSMAQQGDAPTLFGKVNDSGVPTGVILLSGLLTVLRLIFNYALPNAAIELLISLSVAGLLFSWAIITITHLKFHQTMAVSGKKSTFQAFGSPISNYVCLAFLASTMIVMLATPGIRISAILMPVWLVVVYIAYRFIRRNWKGESAQGRSNAQTSV